LYFAAPSKPSGKSPPARVVNILSDPLSSTLLRDKSLEGSGSIIIIIIIIITIIIIIITFGYQARNLLNR